MIHVIVLEMNLDFREKRIQTALIHMIDLHNRGYFAERTP